VSTSILPKWGISPSEKYLSTPTTDAMNSSLLFSGMDRCRISLARRSRWTRRSPPCRRDNGGTDDVCRLAKGQEAQVDARVGFEQ
jgi:hypothetical protein